VGIMAAVTGTPPQMGSSVYIMIDRPWAPPLRVDALAEMVSCESKGDDLHVCYFRFSAIHEADRDSIDEYVASGSELIKKLRRL